MKYLIICVLAFSSVVLNGQINHICGNSVEDQLAAEKIAAMSRPSEWAPTERGAKIYIPVKIHVVTKGDGTGGVRYRDIYKQFCKLNKDYEQWDMFFYPQDGSNFNVIERGDAYSDPRENENVLNAKRDFNALNIFVTGTIGASGVGTGTVLGYYSPTNDLIVCQQKEFQDTSNTLSHEIGHFFSLRHTFFGWECDPYTPMTHGNPVVRTTAPCAPVPVEVVARTNCNSAADELCDTPPDYNFGITNLGANCTFTLDLKDKNGDRIIPMKENQMSYFSACGQYRFTENQADRMLKDYNKAYRDYVKSNFVPKQDPIVGAPELISPAGTEKPPYNGVDVRWTSVANAEQYIVELETSGDYKVYIASDTFVYITDLKANSPYVTKITGVSKGFFCGETSATKVIRTSSTTTNTVEQNLYNRVRIMPNPATDQVNIAIEASLSEAATLQVIDLSGKIVIQTPQQLQVGNNQWSIDLTQFDAGIYIISVTSSRGTVREKLNVIK